MLSLCGGGGTEGDFWAVRAWGRLVVDLRYDSIDGGPALSATEPLFLPSELPRRQGNGFWT